jgi:hypothetical protein
MTGRYKQHCFDSPLVFSLYITIPREPSVVSEEQAGAIVWMGVAGVNGKVERVSTSIVGMSE